jgi:hypothetical protein
MYADIYGQLKTAFENIAVVTEPENISIRIRKRIFKSSGFDEEYISPLNSKPDSKTKLSNEDVPFSDLDANMDNKIETNTSFNYYTVENVKNKNASGVIFLFHGLNEKKWDKYLPWAYQLTKVTGKIVILFPIAFHMNRAPLQWSDSRLMQKLAIARAHKSTNSQSSFVNAAVSERLDSIPQRFFLSGLQTYFDFCKLMKDIRGGQINGISSDASIDLFGYSIGAFFSLLLMLDNPDNLLNDSRLFMFCGGATYDRTFPISKYIVDSRASYSVSFFFDELFKNRSTSEKIFSYYFENLVPEKSHFAGIMNYKQFKDLRERRLIQIYERINAIVLEKDDVVMPREVINSICGESYQIKTKVDIMDFDFPYNHVTPFPISEKYNLRVDKSFKCVMETAGTFLS